MKTTYTDNRSMNRFELTIDGERVAWVDYELDEGAITLNHTEVAPRLRGHGLAGEIVRFALLQARKSGLFVVPECSFAASFIERHPEYAGLVA